MWRLVLVLSGCGFSAKLDAGVDATNARDAFRRSIDITDALVSGSHASFPLVVDLDDSALRSVANGGHVATDEGLDIRFSTDPEGNELLAHDVEVYMPAQGKLIAWVSVPVLTASTVLYMHYGNAAWTPPREPHTVWTTAGFAGVWHLQPSTTDATGQSTTFTDVCAVANGKLAAGRQFDGADAYIDVGSDAKIDDVFAGGGTVEAWFRATSSGESNAGRIVEKGVWLIFLNNTNARFFHAWTGAAGDWSTPITLGAWHHIAVNYDRGSTATLYLDGVAATTTVSSPAGAPYGDDTSSLLIGNRSQLDRAFDGVLDEVRISTDARDPDWIATSYKNQLDPAAFSTLGDEQPY